MKKILIILFVCFLSTIIVGCNDSTIKQYTITFNSNGGTEVSSITQDYNTQVTKPTDPTKAGYTFSGWYSDSDLTQEYTFTTMPKENITLYAKWTELSTEGLIYTVLEDNTCSVREYIGSDPNVLIPKIYNGCLVTKIGEYAFAGTDIVTTVTFEEGSQLTIIGYSAFLGVKSLTSITIPNSVTIIGHSAFRGAKSLATVIFEEGSQLRTIASEAFFDTKCLTNITIPKNVITIGDSVFVGATNLTSINVDVDNSIYSSKDGVLLNKNQTTIILYPPGKKESTYTIPNSVIIIEDLAFVDATSLTTVLFEEGSQLTTIGDSAFIRATSLTNIAIPKSVTTIGSGAFIRATNLTSINVDVDNPEYSSIDGVLLNKNQTLIISYPAGKKESTYTIPDSVTTIGSGVFYESTSLTSITIPNSVTTIGNGAFSETESLTTVIFEEGSQLTTIGDSAFSKSTNLISIIITAPTPPSISNLGISNGDLKIYVPSDYVNIYKTAWPDYASIIHSI